MDEKSVYFNVEAMGKLYGLPLDAETPKEVVITRTLKRQTREALEIIMWLEVE